MKPGDTAIYRGVKVTVVRIDDFPTPSGGRVQAVLIDRPRKGLRWVQPQVLNSVSRQTSPEEPRFVLEP